MKWLSGLLLFWLLYLPSVVKVWAIVDPLAVSNNKFGIHVVDQNDLVSAAHLVNSSGGDWGYVTLVIRSDDRNSGKWQHIFDELRQLHLIPIIRLATVPQKDMWVKPELSDATDWANFLGSLTWVVKNRYVVLFNEPNHAQEWGGDLKPNEYAAIAVRYAQTLKSMSPDFFILPSGFDAAAGNGAQTMDLSQFLKFMHAADPNVFKIFDGWTSHAYPNPDFSGSLYDRGKTSIVSYRFETTLAQSLGLKPNLPVFITETGWVHHEGLVSQYGAYSAQVVANLLVSAFQKVWTDPSIVAITPFMLNYQAAPFDHFSWYKPGGQEVYPQYAAVQALIKVGGQPVIDEDSLLTSTAIPGTLVTNSVYEFPVNFKNTGETIWTPQNYQIVIEGSLIPNRLAYPLPQTEPGGDGKTTIHLETPVTAGDLSLTIRVEHNHQPVGQIQEKQIHLIPPPSLLVKAQTWYRKVSSGDDFTLLIYNQGELKKKLTGFSVTDGVGQISEIRDIIPNQDYRFVLTKPYYLPRQSFAYLNPTQTTVTFQRLIPVDFNLDGQLSVMDFFTALIHPQAVYDLLLRPLLPW